MAGASRGPMTLDAEMLEILIAGRDMGRIGPHQ